VPSAPHGKNEAGEELALAGDCELGIDALAAVLRRALGDLPLSDEASFVNGAI
jgi:hypothetical protein